MIGFIGGGNMAGALIRGLVSGGRREIIVSEPRAERREELSRTLGVRTTPENAEVMAHATIVVLAVKPQQMDGVLREIAPHVTDRHMIVSIAAGVTIAYIEERLHTRRIVRVMPNVASMVGEGMAVMSLCECMSDAEVIGVRDIFMLSGKALVLPEKHMDAVTALSGSGPGFLAHILHLMIEAGRELGLPEREAMELGLQTFVGTARLLEEGTPPERLVEMVRSPGGTTEAGLRTFEERGLAGVVSAALRNARDRGRELAR